MKNFSTAYSNYFRFQEVDDNFIPGVGPGFSKKKI